MTVRQNLLLLRESFFQNVTTIFHAIAKKFGFPENPGMLIVPQQEYFWNQPRLNDNLPIRQVHFPPETFPKNYIEILIGDMPKPLEITKHYYESNADGFYNFYYENFKNYIYLPNQLSEFLQVRCGFCLDITFLEVSREMIFLLFVCYYYLISLRMLLGWIVTLNPYTIPACYLVALVDWVEDASMGLSPTLAGVSLTTPILLMIVGKIADSLNYLVFTMPFLPSEGTPAKVFINGDLKDVLLFRHLPILWYKYPIPNDIREYWFYERPDILDFMIKAYHNTDIRFYPDHLTSF